jgi:phosphatidylserine/phosphatidylglycerophosphate/cardiolipin synthase-like enzyme
MTATIPVGVKGGRAQLVSDDGYLPVLRSMIADARRSCLCSLFLIDLAPRHDRELLVDSVLRDLAAAHWRGVDVRLLIGGSRDNLEIAEAADLARARALQLGIPARWATSRPIRGSHAKFVLVDEQVLTGSHNWSVGAFTSQTQDSVVVASRDIAAYVAGLFERQWAEAAEG